MQNKPHRLSFILINMMAEGYVTKNANYIERVEVLLLFLDSMKDQWQIYSFDRAFMKQYSKWKMINGRTQEEFK